jgi:anthranilate phosphoribosyltransferase
MTEVKILIENVSKKRNLTFEESKKVFLSIMEGKVNENLIYNFLVKLAEKGETAEEIAGGVNTLREKAIKVETLNNVIDTCGTGGDGKNTLNISTASSLLLASMGVKVAKHGNKALSSKCGSADVLERLKININLKSDGVAESIQKNNFGFMFAPNYHFAMKYVAPIRKKIGKRTIFNLLGPLSSPANVKRQVVGVFDKKWLLPFANALKNLNSTHAWIVHSEDGMDEISPFSPTDIVELKNNQINMFKINPKDLDIKFNKPENLIGQDSNYNANKIIDVFGGEKNEFSEAICLNAAAALIISGKFLNYKEAYIYAKNHLESDKVILHLKKIQAF